MNAGYDDDILSLIEDGAEDAADPGARHWKVLIVDDDQDVHDTTVLALSRTPILGRPLKFIHAYSAADAEQKLRQETDIAVILLDVVMEREDAGLQLVKVIRDVLRIAEMRIILRTGQPGYAPEMDAIRDYDINDYKTKSELSRNRIYTTLTAAIRCYEQIHAINASRRELDRVLVLSREMALRNQVVAQRENDLKLIIENVPAGIASFDTGFRVRFANTRYASLFDLSPEQIVGKHVSEYVAADVLESLMPRWKQCLEGVSVSYRRTSRDPLTGKDAVMDVELVPEFEQGQVKGLFGLLIDVTEQSAAENRMRELNDTLKRRVEERSADLERAMDTLRHSQEELARSEAKATLSSLVASVSHELSTPIGNSVMAASTLGDHARSFETLVDSGQIKRSDLKRIISALQEGTELLQRNLGRAEDLLKNFRQVAADQASEQRRSFDLATVVREIVDTLAPSLKRHPHRIVLDIPAGITLDSLPGPLGQIVINLINNAYLHAFEGRNNGLLTLSAQATGREVVLQVADNGSGIAPENLKRLFQPFFSTKIGEGGTGLGMSIVENLVRKTLGGSVEVHSEVGVGTRFEIRLPLVAPGP